MPCQKCVHPFISKNLSLAFVKKDLHCTRIFDFADRFTPDSFLQSQLELARASANFGAEIVLPVKIILKYILLIDYFTKSNL